MPIFFYLYTTVLAHMIILSKEGVDHTHIHIPGAPPMKSPRNHWKRLLHLPVLQKYFVFHILRISHEVKEIKDAYLPELKSAPPLRKLDHPILQIPFH